MMQASVPILGVPVAVTTYERVIEYVQRWIHKKHGTYVFVAASHLLVECRDDHVLLESAQHAGLVVPDGMPLVFLQRLMGYSSAQRVYGPELFLRLCMKAARAGWRIFLLGGAPGQSRRVREELQTRFPTIHIVGELDTPKRPPSTQENERATWHIKRTGAHLVFLGLGCPHQERWMAEHHERLPGVVLIGVGAAFDFVSGRARQAPKWAQNAGFEWLFRLLHEPTKLWYRYTIVSARFLSFVLQQFVRDIVRSQS